MNAETTTRSFDHNRPDFTPYGLTCVYWQPSPMQRPDHHNEVELNFLKSGSVTYLLGGKKTTVERGKLSVFWAAVPHQIIYFQGDVEFLVATIPLQDFLQWRLPEEFVQSLMQSQFICEKSSDHSKTDALLFESWQQDLLTKKAGIERPVLLEMHARLARLALNFATVKDEDKKRDHLSSITDNGLNKVEQMACYIARNYTQKLTVNQIGDHVNLHPNYAMNLFQKTFGTTLINYLTQHRVSHAQRLLVTSEQPVTDIALASGFSSISRFNDAFYRLCGCSPRNYRKSRGLIEFSSRKRYSRNRKNAEN